MKKYIVMSISFFISFSVFAQSWTVRHNLGGEIGEVDYEYTVINKDQYDRLLRQRTALEEYAAVTFQDILEMSQTGRVVRGSRPNFNGYYYLLVKLTALTDRGKQLLNTLGMGTGIMYGNSNTGVLVMMFANYLASFDISANVNLLGSNDFIRIYNQCISFVNGE